MDELNSVRIVLLGKTGSGKSSLANTIFGQKVFTIGHLPVSESSPSRAETRLVCGRNITLIDTRCVFDTSVSENDLKEEILSCITQCAPGPHVFLIVLKVEKFTEHEKDVIKTICQHFSEDALKFAAVVFTHGDQLPVGMRIEEFVGQNKSLSDLLRRCGGRCHVVDNKYWKVDGDDPYRSNKSQVTEILKTTEKISMTNGGKCYTNEILQQVNRDIQIEEETIGESSANMSREEIRNRARSNVLKRWLVTLVGAATGALLGAFLGLVQSIADVVSNLQGPSNSLGKGKASLDAALKAGIRGGMIGYQAAADARDVEDAFQRAKKDVWNNSSMSGLECRSEDK
ncbi:GTPase IMAP family member 7-like [Nothobranchius furzeri]|uniref:GTPase IMAP family member 7-like n=1 Tax=Nothobranchius furzeri TaxID=105023 RepID=A0A9D2Y7E0_NOTFU|nr:GTPase IMAP family member 7-like [Nothobranchius furzeri]